MEAIWMYRSNGRFFAALFSVLWFFTVCNGIISSLGCVNKSQSEELFFYRTETVEAEITMECNGVRSRFTYCGNAEECRIDFLEPSELYGFSLEIAEGRGQVSVDGLTAEAPEALCIIPNIMRKIFTLSPESVTAIETAPHPENGVETVTKITADGITVTLNKNGLPIRAEGVLFDTPFTTEISAFQPAAQSLRAQ